MGNKMLKVNPIFLARAEEIKRDLDNLGKQLTLTPEQREEFINQKTKAQHKIYHALLENENRWIQPLHMEEAFPGIMGDIYQGEEGIMYLTTFEGMDDSGYPFLEITQEEYDKQELEDILAEAMEDAILPHCSVSIDKRAMESINADIDISINYNKQIEVDASCLIDIVENEAEIRLCEDRISKEILRIIYKNGYQITKKS